MKHLVFTKYLCVALWLFVAVSMAHAAWVLDGNIVNDPVQLDPWDPQLVTCQDGGVIVVYVAHETGYHDIWAQRYDAWGNVLWGPVPVAVELNEQYAPAAVSDGTNGVIVAWTDFRTGTTEGIYAQRVDLNGTPVWAPNGIPLVIGTGTDPRICSDHAGGAVVSWRDTRGADNDIYAQRLSPAGSELWTGGGFGVCTTAGDQGDFVMASNGMGGAYFAWDVGANGIFGQHVNAGGWLEWHLYPGGVPICAAGGSQWSPVITADGNGRMIVAWLDLRTANFEIYAQLMNAYGNDVWAPDGVSLISILGGIYDPAIASDGEGGAIVVWDDGDLFAQRINVDGDPVWGSAGAPVCESFGSQHTPRVVPDGDGGAIFAWEDSRFSNYNVYAQRLSREGTPIWPANGVAVCSALGDERMPLLTGDGAGGGYLVWPDTRANDYENDIYLQRMDRSGHWGYPSPTIVAVEDIPGDQGGQVNVSWQASRLDPWPIQSIETYSLWRALEEPGTKAVAAGAVLVDLADFEPGRKGRFIRKDSDPDKSLYWEYLGDVLARNLPQYAQALPTLFNLTPESPGYHAFQIIAHGPTVDGMGYWISQPDTGRSIDNLAPDAPAMVMGEQVYEPTRLEIRWEPNAEADMSNYEVYRGTAAGFIPSTANLVGSPVDPALTLGGSQADYYYKVSARDVHGNESEFALLAPAEVSATGTVPEATALSGVHPNPFNPKATIAFTVRDPQRITVAVYDVTGRRVAVLTDEVWPAGRHDLTWNGRDTSGREMSSGVYFVNFRAIDTAVTEKVMLVR